MANSGKVKRIHNNGRVNVATRKMSGKVIGVWIPAQAREIVDQEIVMKVNKLLDKKYGLMNKLFDNQRTQNDSKGTVLEIKLSE